MRYDARRLRTLAGVMSFSTLLILALPTLIPGGHYTSLQQRLDSLLGAKKRRFSFVAHSSPGVGSDFWAQLRLGVDDMSTYDKRRLRFIETDYDSARHAESIRASCADSEAMAVTVPFERGGDAYGLVDAAITECIQTGTRVVIFNTDTYHNEEAIGFVGPDNGHIGTVCARHVLTNFSADAMRMEVTGQNVIAFDTPQTLHLYVHPSEVGNSGIQRRAASMQSTINAWTSVTRLTAVVVNEAPVVAQGSPRTVAMGIGAALRAVELGSDTVMNCGDVLKFGNMTLSLGQVPYAQGQAAYNLLVSSQFAGHQEFVPKGNFIFTLLIIGLTFVTSKTVVGSLGLAAPLVAGAVHGILEGSSED